MSLPTHKDTWATLSQCFGHPIDDAGKKRVADAIKKAVRANVAPRTFGEGFSRYHAEIQRLSIERAIRVRFAGYNSGLTLAAFLSCAAAWHFGAPGHAAIFVAVLLNALTDSILARRRDAQIAELDARYMLGEFG